MEELLAAGADGRGALPPTLRDALMVRVERAPEAAQEVLRLLAVAGAPGPRAAGGGRRPRAARAARGAARGGRRAPRRGRQRGPYAFRHALQREVVADDLLPGERAELHRRIADALERRARPEPAHAGPSAQRGHRAAPPRERATSPPRCARASRPRTPPSASTPTARPPPCWSARSSSSTRVPERGGAGRHRPRRAARPGRRRAPAGRRPLRGGGAARAALEALDPDRDRRARRRRPGAPLAGAVDARPRDAALETARRGLELLPEDEPSEERAALTSWWAKMRMLQGRYREAAADRARTPRPSPSGRRRRLARARARRAGRVAHGAGRARGGEPRAARGDRRRARELDRPARAGQRLHEPRRLAAPAGPARARR